MRGTAECKLLIMQHGDEARFVFNAYDIDIEANVKAHHGCSVCWDSDSEPGMRHLAGKCQFLNKANTERAKHGMDPILIVEKTAVATVGERAKLPLDARITQLETENSTLRSQVRTLITRVDDLTKGTGGSNVGFNGGHGGFSGGPNGGFYGGQGGSKKARRKANVVKKD